MKCGLLIIDPSIETIMVSPDCLKPSGADIQLWIPGKGCLSGANLGKPFLISWDKESAKNFSWEEFDKKEGDFSATISKKYADIPDAEIKRIVSIFETDIETEKKEQILSIWPEILNFFQD